MDKIIHKLSSARMPTDHGEFEMYAFGMDGDDYTPHIALVSTDLDTSESVLVRIHSECITGDLFSSKRCDCGEQLRTSLDRTGAEGGVVLYLRQEGRGIGIVNKLKAYNLQDQGMNTAEANEALGFEIDQRDFQAAKDILSLLGINKIKLLTNNPEKISAFDTGDVKVVSRESIVIPACSENYDYLRTKQDSMGHLLELKEQTFLVEANS